MNPRNRGRARGGLTESQARALRGIRDGYLKCLGDMAEADRMIERGFARWNIATRELTAAGRAALAAYDAHAARKEREDG
jgi:hypothetical protein